MDKIFKNNGESEKQYLNLIEKIIQTGYKRPDRTNTGTRAIHGHTLRFDLSDGTIPLMTSKFVPWRAIAHELMWFLSGETNIAPLLKNNVHIWSDWPHDKYVRQTNDNISMKEFEGRILESNEFAEKWGSIGPGYGYQWRRWKGADGKEYDQIKDVVDRIKNDPYSRRLIFHGWNVADLDQMALPPCHLLYQFFVAEGRLSLTMYQRSVDVGLGLPFNLASCAMLVRMVAQQCNLKPGELFWVGHDVHVYENHVEPLGEQIKREPKPYPVFTLKDPGPKSIFDYSIEDMMVEGYEHHPSIKMNVAV